MPNSLESRNGIYAAGNDMSFLLKILEISAIFNLSFKFFFFKNNLIYHKYLKYYETKLIATMLEW